MSPVRPRWSSTRRARVLAFNKPAQALFAGIEKDADARSLLSLDRNAGALVGAGPDGSPQDAGRDRTAHLSGHELGIAAAR